MRKNIVLTGFMGTGKTAVGRELARLLNMRIVDIDEEIEKERGMKITEIFAGFGEEHFRNLESEMIRRFAGSENTIISTGGGAVLRAENIEALREKGIIFCLSAGPAAILERIKGNDDRPLLKVPDPLAKINELLACRRQYYEKAGAMIETEGKSPLNVALEIIEAMKCEK